MMKKHIWEYILIGLAIVIILYLLLKSNASIATAGVSPTSAVPSQSVGSENLTAGQNPYSSQPFNITPFKLQVPTFNITDFNITDWTIPQNWNTELSGNNNMAVQDCPYCSGTNFVNSENDIYGGNKS